MNVESSSVSARHYIWGICGFFFAAIRRWFVLVLVAPLATAAVGYAVTFTLVEPAYIGSATIQCGKVAGTPVQTAQFMIDRISSPMFKNSVLRTLHLDAGKEQAGDLMYQSLAARAMAPKAPVPDTIEVSAYGYDREEMTAMLQAIPDLLGQQQADLIEAGIDSLKTKLAQNEANLVRLNAARKALMDTFAHSVRGNSADSVESTASQLQLQMIGEADQEIGQANQERIDLNEDVGPQRTFAARMLGDVLVTPVPVFPRCLYAAGLVWTGVFMLCAFFAVATAPTRREGARIDASEL